MPVRPREPHPLDDPDPAPGALATAATVRTDARVIALPPRCGGSAGSRRPPPRLPESAIPPSTTRDWGDDPGAVELRHAVARRDGRRVRTARPRTRTSTIRSRSTRPSPRMRTRSAIIACGSPCADPPERAELAFRRDRGRRRRLAQRHAARARRGAAGCRPCSTCRGCVAAENVLVVRVHQFSAATYLEDQDEWWLPGIIREVTLLRAPVDGDPRRARRRRLGCGRRASRAWRSRRTPPTCGPRSSNWASPCPSARRSRVPGARPWSAEDPVLYTLRVSTAGETVETSHRLPDDRDRRRGLHRERGARSSCAA